MKILGKLRLSSFIILQIFLFSLHGKCQADKKLSFGAIDFFASDVLNNFYVVQKNNLCKYSGEQKIIGCKQFGMGAIPLTIDVSNPHKILFYSQQQQLLYFLNSQLADIAVFNLGQIAGNDYQIGNCCASNIANFWAYDQALDKLLLFDTQLKIIRESNSLFQQIGVVIQPNEMMECSNYLIVSNKEQGIFVFDLFGNYIYKILFFNYKKVQVINNNLISIYDDKYFIFNLKTRQELQYPMPVKNFRFVSVVNNSFYFIDSIGLLIVRELH